MPAVFFRERTGDSGRLSRKGTEMEGKCCNMEADKCPGETGYRVERIEWDSPDGELARRIRFEVFVDEQMVPREEEIDAVDPEAYHVLACAADGRACGTARLFPDLRDPSCARIGRMAVVRGARGTGCGAAIMRGLLDECRRRGVRRVVLSAQGHAIGFYAKFGFKAFGQHYMDVNIPHQDMQLRFDAEGRAIS
jgi:predicted GNAT family N-acyltransferase